MYRTVLTTPEMSGLLAGLVRLFLYCCTGLIAVQLASAADTQYSILQAAYPAKISSSGSHNPLQDNTLSIELTRIQQLLKPKSCQDIHTSNPTAPSGYYCIQASKIRVYCDMEGTNCGGEGGWTRVAYVDMRQSGATCPQGLSQTNISGKLLCGRKDGDFAVVPNSENGGCQSTVFSTLSLHYNEVCGQLRGYQQGSPDAFHPYNIDTSRTLNDPYFDGASVTYGSPRTHLWSYVNGFATDLPSNNDAGWFCPCNSNPQHSASVVPPYVGSHYYCESSNNIPNVYNDPLLDPLWDGQQCVGAEATCCTNPNMPWFIRSLTSSTSDDIEVRVCSDQPAFHEDSKLEVIEILIRGH